MQRDMDIIRQIALRVAELEYGDQLTEIDGVSAEAFALHATWMEEAGLIKATITEFLGDEIPAVFIHRLTWEGCEFADAIKSDTLWQKAKQTVIKPTASFTFGLLKEWLKTELQHGFPTLRT